MVLQVGSQVLTRIEEEDVIIYLFASSSISSIKKTKESSLQEAVTAQTAIDIETPRLYVLKNTSSNLHTLFPALPHDAKKSILVVRSKAQLLQSYEIFSYEGEYTIHPDFVKSGGLYPLDMDLLRTNFLDLNWTYIGCYDGASSKIVASPARSRPTSATGMLAGSVVNEAPLEVDTHRLRTSVSVDFGDPTIPDKLRAASAPSTPVNARKVIVRRTPPHYQGLAASSAAKVVASNLKDGRSPPRSNEFVVEATTHQVQPDSPTFESNTGGISALTLAGAVSTLTGTASAVSVDEQEVFPVIIRSPQDLNAQFSTGASEKQIYLTNFFNYFDARPITDEATRDCRSKEAINFILWLLHPCNSHLLNKSRHTLFETYSIYNRSPIQVLRFLELQYPEVTVDKRLIELKRQHTKIQKSDHYQDIKTISVNGRNIELSQQVDTVIATIPNRVEPVILSWSQLSKNQAKRFTHKNCLGRFIRSQPFSYDELNALFKYDSVIGDKTVYVKRIIEYFTLENHPVDTDIQDRVKQEAINFVIGLIANRNSNFCRKPKTSGFYAIFAATDGDSRSFSELLRYFADVFGVGTDFNQRTGILTELHRIAQKSKGCLYSYWKQTQSTSYVPTAKNISINGQNIGTPTATVEIGGPKSSCFPWRRP